MNDFDQGLIYDGKKYYICPTSRLVVRHFKIQNNGQNVNYLLYGKNIIFNPTLMTTTLSDGKT